MIEKTGVIGGLDLPEKAEDTRERERLTERLWRALTAHVKPNDEIRRRRRGAVLTATRVDDAT